uniref:Cortactin n=1 Tax=Rousettus aegyptiacus TaxID=9407 RepID=A0A7J8GYG9_ROUAE|nr:cortactin [Rousettus aegyptiacus]
MGGQNRAGLRAPGAYQHPQAEGECFSRTPDAQGEGAGNRAQGLPASGTWPGGRRAYPLPRAVVHPALATVRSGLYAVTVSESL